MKGKNKNNFDVDNAAALVSDFGSASPVSKKEPFQMLDVVQYGDGENAHFGNVLFTDDDGDTKVFSRLGKEGPFRVRPMNDSEITQSYGGVTGVFRPRN